MNHMSSFYNIRFGIISYCPEDTELQKVRAHAHSLQLDWLATVNTYGANVYRIEQHYTPEFREAVATALPIVSKVFAEGIGPAAARNELLKDFYSSDDDWLICMDDDRCLYSHYGSHLFFYDLQYSLQLNKLCKEGVLITGVVPAYSPFKEANAQFGMCDIAWNIKKAMLSGCLQICCIPNLVKYGHRAVWFDPGLNFLKGDMPEDVKFEIDWISEKHPVALNQMMIIKELATHNQEDSTVYPTRAKRTEAEKLQPAAVRKYIREITRNRIQTLKDYNARRNDFSNLAIRRYHSYTLVPSDYGKFTPTKR